MGILLVLVVITATAVVVAVLRNEGRRSRARAELAVVEVDTAGVRRRRADGVVEEVWWAELREVEVLRAAIGPHRASGGVVLLGAGPERGALVPIDRVDVSGLRSHLRALEGFDMAAFDLACVARAPSRTVVWERPVDG